MTDLERLERRLAAVERTVTETDRPPEELPERAALADAVDDLETRLEELAERVTELEGSTQALRGYVGNVRAVNDDVTQRADSAVATVDRLEKRVDRLEGIEESDRPRPVLEAIERDVVTDDLETPAESEPPDGAEDDPPAEDSDGSASDGTVDGLLEAVRRRW